MRLPSWFCNIALILLTRLSLLVDSRVESGTSDINAAIPIITSEQFNTYLISLIKLLIGEQMLNEWIKKGMRLAVSFSTQG